MYPKQDGGCQRNYEILKVKEKYSTNKMRFGNWIFSNYSIEDGSRVLELGCGTGDMWTVCEQRIPTGAVRFFGGHAEYRNITDEIIMLKKELQESAL